MKKSVLSFLALGALLLGFTSCGEIKRGEYVKGAGSIYCDDGFKNILEEEIDVFEYQYHDSSIIPTYVSEGEALDALMEDKTDAVIVTQELTPEQRDFIKKKYKKIVKSKPIAVDAVALIVNKDNPLSSLSMEEIGQLLRGNISKWDQLAVNDTAKIKLVFDSQESSTVSYLKEKFLDKGKISDNPNAFAQKNNAGVFDVVKKDPNAIGIISVSWLGSNLEKAKQIPMEKRLENYGDESETVVSNLTTEVKIIKVSNPTEENDNSLIAYLPYQQYIATGEYPLFRKVYMITTASNSTLMKSFYDFVTGFVGQKIISLTGIMPYNVQPRVVELK